MSWRAEMERELRSKAYAGLEIVRQSRPSKDVAANLTGVVADVLQVNSSINPILNSVAGELDQHTEMLPAKESKSNSSFMSSIDDACRCK